MTPHLFTLLCQYKGGTYTTQLRASAPRTAFAHWAARFPSEGILTAAEQEHFRVAVAYALSDAGGLVALEGLHHVWYEGFSVGEDLLEVTVVATFAAAEIPGRAPAPRRRISKS